MAESERFVSVDDEDLDALLDNKDSKNTKTCIKSAVNILTAFCASRNILFRDLEQMSEADLCSQLKSFYAAVRSQKGDLYSKKSMISIRYGIQKQFLKIKDTDVVNNDAFKPANLVFQAMLVKLKQEGKGTSVHKLPIEVDDIAIIYKSFNLDVPNDLQNKVFVDFMLFYCNRGRENLRELKKTDFSFHGSGDNKYIALRDHSTKNHRGDNKDDNESQGGRLYVMPSNPLCPVISFVKYLSVLHPDCEYFWQRPKPIEKKPVDIWFDKAPLGKNTLGDKMKNLSKQLNLSKLYTNHSLRATTITLLDNKGFEARHILSISGHKTESSIRNYSRTDDTHKRKIAKALSDTIIGHASASKKGCEMGPSVDKLINPVRHDTSCIDDDSHVENTSEPVVKHSSGKTDIEFENMDFLELTSSRELLLFEAVCNVSSDVPIVQSEPTRTVVNTTRHVEHKTSTVLADKTNFHIHYH